MSKDCTKHCSGAVLSLVSLWESNKGILEDWNLNQQQRNPNWAQMAITCLNPSY